MLSAVVVVATVVVSDIDTFIAIIQNEGLVVKAKFAKSLEFFPAERAVAIAKVLDAFALKNREAADASKILDNTIAFVMARLLKRLLPPDDQQLAGLAGGGGNTSENSASGKKNEFDPKPLSEWWSDNIQREIQPDEGEGNSTEVKFPSYVKNAIARHVNLVLNSFMAESYSPIKEGNSKIDTVAIQFQQPTAVHAAMASVKSPKGSGPGNARIKADVVRVRVVEADGPDAHKPFRFLFWGDVVGELVAQSFSKGMVIPFG